MLPNYKDGMIVVADKVYADTKIERYDVVVSKTDIGIIIKRVVGLPGEEIEIDLDGNILSNGKFLNEWKSYTAEDMTIINTSKYVLAEDEYFLIGDNVNHSSDSRKLGPIKLQNIMGIVR